eukprot:CAMPEP_0194361590 /NCGR_PEP_ID=MMETSP0174-20130528/9138_1 /TAXON_ID=216777 /ORGANISM="Proboscia alata, Strain PI-D3" /LENGTH=78 /DNA_ID=CAMNT_0039133857 /DNA_START=12 /DNA_END=245 /DNA_ORIENTATION=+
MPGLNSSWEDSPVIDKKTASLGGGKLTSFGSGEFSKNLLKSRNARRKPSSNVYENNELSRRDFTMPGLNSSYEAMPVL